jgi:hypothetical protein
VLGFETGNAATCLPPEKQYANRGDTGGTAAAAAASAAAAATAEVGWLLLLLLLLMTAVSFWPAPMSPETCRCC